MADATETSNIHREALSLEEGSERLRSVPDAQHDEIVNLFAPYHNMENWHEAVRRKHTLMSLLDIHKIKEIEIGETDGC